MAFQMVAIDITEEEYVRFKMECTRRRQFVGRVIGEVVRAHLKKWENESAKKAEKAIKQPEPVKA